MFKELCGGKQRKRERKVANTASPQRLKKAVIYKTQAKELAEVRESNLSPETGGKRVRKKAECERLAWGGGQQSQGPHYRERG